MQHSIAGQSGWSDDTSVRLAQLEDLYLVVGRFLQQYANENIVGVCELRKAWDACTLHCVHTSSTDDVENRIDRISHRQAQGGSVLSHAMS